MKRPSFALLVLLGFFGFARDVSAPLTSESVEQKFQGKNPPPEILVCFDGLGEGFEGPQGKAVFRNPSDNSLAVGPDHIVQIVNSRMAVFTKKGARFDTTGTVLYGPVPTNNLFKGFGDAGEINNGDAVVRYDQLADRWLIVYAAPAPKFAVFQKFAIGGDGGWDCLSIDSGAHRASRLWWM